MLNMGDRHFHLSFSLYCVLERESENFTKKLKEFSKEILKKVAGCFGEAFWKSLIGFQGLVEVFACLDKR